MTIDERLEALAARQEKTDRILRRAIRAGVKEARQERQKRREGLSELDGYITRLAAAQLVTEESLQKLGGKIDKLVSGLLHPGGNGKGKK
jgi:hypothetical protein